MIVKVQIFIKTFFVIGMVLFSANASASYWLECIGLVTIKSDIAEITNYSEAKEKYIKADFYIHDHTFTCKGHGSKIDIKGIRKNTKISFLALINEGMFKKGTHLQVEYIHVNSMLPSGGSTNVGWTVLKTVKTIPPEKISPQRVKPKQIPESTSEGVDLSVEESLWEKYKDALPSYKELEGSPLKNENISDTNDLFSIYRGNLFKVIYPKSFSVKPLKPIVLFDANFYQNEHLEVEPKLPPKYLEYVDTDEAYFKSSDGLVEFFVYAKDSSDNPQNYTKVTGDEIKLSSSSEKFSFKKEHLNYVIKAWVTIKAKDNSYYRSYIHQRACHDDFSTCETQVFGIKYSSTEAYNKYRDFFIGFTRSLVRTAEF